MSNNLIVAWLDAKQKLEDAKAAELLLRNTVYESYSDKREAGTENYPANGGNLKIVSKLNYNLPNREQTDAVLRQIAALSAEAGFIASRLVKWTPELSVSEYKKLASDSPIKAIIDRIITTKPAQPTISFGEEKDT